MYGSTTGTALLQGSNDGTSWTSLWSKSGRRDRSKEMRRRRRRSKDTTNSRSWWCSSTVSMGIGRFEWLRFHYTSGTSNTGDFALDDISVTLVETGIVDDTSSFETDFDEWTTGNGVHSRPFTRYSGSTPSIATGPQGAASGSHFVYAETSGQVQYPTSSQSFDLRKTFPEGELYGIAFQYHMYGVNMGSAVLESSADGTSWVSLWSKAGQQSSSWLWATAFPESGHTILRYTYVPNRLVSRHATNQCNHPVALRYTSGPSALGDFALDDIRIGDCSIVGCSTDSCPSGHTMMNHQYDNADGSPNCDCVPLADVCMTDMGPEGPHCILDTRCGKCDTVTGRCIP